MSTIVSAVVSFVLFFGGMYLFAFAFQDATWPDFAKGALFIAGVIAISLAIALPAHALANNDRN